MYYLNPRSLKNKCYYQKNNNTKKVLLLIYAERVNWQSDFSERKRKNEEVRFQYIFT